MLGDFDHNALLAKEGLTPSATQMLSTPCFNPFKQGVFSICVADGVRPSLANRASIEATVWLGGSQTL